MRLFRPLLTPVSAAPSLPASQSTVCTSRFARLRLSEKLREHNFRNVMRGLSPSNLSERTLTSAQGRRCLPLEVVSFRLPLGEVHPLEQQPRQGAKGDGARPHLSRIEKIVPSHRLSFWRGVLRDYLLRRRWMLKFLGKKRKGNF